MSAPAGRRPIQRGGGEELGLAGASGGKLGYVGKFRDRIMDGEGDKEAREPTALVALVGKGSSPPSLGPPCA